MFEDQGVPTSDSSARPSSLGLHPFEGKGWVLGLALGGHGQVQHSPTLPDVGWMSPPSPSHPAPSERQRTQHLGKAGSQSLMETC